MNTNQKHIAVVGLGYVGLTLSIVLAELGCKVTGIEKRKEVVAKTNEGKPHFTEPGISEALVRVTSSGKLHAYESFPDHEQYDAYIITVGTPLNKQGRVRLDMLYSAARQVAEHMQGDSLIILRSTVKIGTTRKLAKEVFEQSGKSFEIAMCPERTLEGNAIHELRDLPQIVGANNDLAQRRAGEVFSIITNKIVQVSSTESAEMVKLIDNSYRDLQFAFANEIARACDGIGISAYEVISSGKLGYSRTKVALPGLVGGPCLEKDPHILRESLLDYNIDLEITGAARLVNERQPKETVGFIVSEIQRRKLPSQINIAILGMAFKGIPETDDLRGSMSTVVLKAYSESRKQDTITLYDPVISAEVLAKSFKDIRVASDINSATQGKHIVIIANNHPSFSRLEPQSLLSKMEQGAFIYDYWNHFSNYFANENYFSVGSAGVRHA